MVVGEIEGGPLPPGKEGKRERRASLGTTLQTPLPLHSTRLLLSDPLRLAPVPLTETALFFFLQFVSSLPPCRTLDTHSRSSKCIMSPPSPTDHTLRHRTSTRNSRTPPTAPQLLGSLRLPLRTCPKRCFKKARFIISPHFG